MKKPELIEYLLNDFEKTMKGYVTTDYTRLSDMLNLLNEDELTILKNEAEKQNEK